jgi:ribonucleotide monophosphatase NagD (HAD superfamily)
MAASSGGNKNILLLLVVVCVVLLRIQQQQVVYSFPVFPASTAARATTTSRSRAAKRSTGGSGVVVRDSGLFASFSSAKMTTASTGTSTTEQQQQQQQQQQHHQMKGIGGLSEISDRYDTFLLDMWGVLHDGTKTYRSVLETIQQLRQNGKRLVILSNSSKRLEDAQRLLQKLGFDLDWFDAIWTSGEHTHGLLLHGGGNFHAGSSSGDPPWLFRHLHDKPRTCFCLGSGDGDRRYVETGTGWQMVDSVDAASLVLARGTFTVHETRYDTTNHAGMEAYQVALTAALRLAARRKLPMVVANPDFIRPDGDRSPMPGSIGAQYQRILAREWDVDDQTAKDLVYCIGKPFPVVYDAILKELFSDDGCNNQRSRVCMVGDALETDILGGQRSGIDTVWVTADGIHGCNATTAGQVLSDWNNKSWNDDDDDDDDDADHWQPRYSQRGEHCLPTYQMDHFQW